MSARDVLREALADSFDVGNMAAAVEQLRFEERAAARLDMADEALDALLAHPVELVALLAEPKVCETCWGRVNDIAPGAKCKNPACDGGSVAVDVLDLLVQAGLVEEVGHMKAHPLEILPTRPVFAAKDGTP